MFKKIKVVSYVVITLTVITFLLTGCSTSSTTDNTNPPLKVAWSLWPGWYPFVIAHEKGFFAAHGANIEPILYESYAIMLPDTSAGKLDGTAIVIGDVFATFGSDEARIVLVTDNSNGADQVVASPDIATPADLSGKQIGVTLGSFSELFVREMIAQHGLSIDDVTLVDTRVETSAQAIPTQVDAIHIYEPYTSESIALGNHIIFSSEQTPGLIPAVVVFRKEVVEARPDDIRAFVAAWFEAVEWWEANQQEGNEIIAAAIGLTPEDISTEGVKIFTLADNLTAFEPGDDTISLYFTSQKYIDFFASVGALSIPPDLTTLIDPSFLP